MEIYCTVEFKFEFDKLMRKNSYKNLETALVEYFFAKDLQIENLKLGRNLIKNNENPFIRNRILGSSGYRCYHYLLIKDNKVYLTYIHPKTGVRGVSNTEKSKNKLLLNNLIDDIKNNNLITVTCVKDNLVFTTITCLPNN
jgi:hypothetical protein